jgi:hypothetical protein
VSVPPALDRKIVEALVQEWLPQAKERRLLLAYGRYTDGTTEFPVTVDGTRHRVHVTDEHSVLGVVEAWEHHRRSRPGNEILVVTTSVRDEDLGWDVRAYAIKRSVQMADRVRIVAQRFGAVDVDPRIRREKWLADALLAAEPVEGWPRSGSVLTRDAAVRALIGARLGRTAVAEGALDAGALLEWSLDPAGPVRFAELPPAEREGLTDWLVGTSGPVAAVLMRLATEKRAGDAMPLGIVGTAATSETAPSDAMLGFGALIGGGNTAELRAFSNAVEGLLERWVAEAETGGRHGEEARLTVLRVLKRADDLAAEVKLTAALGESRFLPSAYSSRLGKLAVALVPGDPAAVGEAERELTELRAHCFARLMPLRQQAAEMAVRLLRWLAKPQAPAGPVAASIRDHMAIGAWVDRALTVLWEGDAANDPVAGQAYRTVCEAVRAQREMLDEAFAGKLAAWARHASVTESAGCVLIEQVLREFARPLAMSTPPLIVVLDGMSAAIALDFAEQAANRGWIEVSPTPARAGAVAVIPSVTTASRASLLSGGLTTGDQAREREGFTKFWRKHNREAALFHKADIAGGAGRRLSDELMAALAEERTVVGVVLNTIDDALDHGSPGDRTRWSLADITYLPELLDAARGYGRPVLLVSDHGHVLHRTEEPPATKPGTESARWRTGTPEKGEVALSGPRVLYGGGSIVAAWREDLRYTPRKAGYHGGASLAEMTVPVLMFLPSADDLPQGWHELFGPDVTPAWWEPRAKTAPAAPPSQQPKPKPRKQKPPTDAVPLFAVEQTVEQTAESLGSRIVATDVYAGQRTFVRKAPDNQTVAAVIDALAQADESLPLSTVASVAGRSGRRAEYFVAVLQRLLNVDGYPVISLVDGDRRLKLEVEMLRLQFGVRAP